MAAASGSKPACTFAVLPWPALWAACFATACVWKVPQSGPEPASRPPIDGGCRNECEARRSDRWDSDARVDAVRAALLPDAPEAFTVMTWNLEWFQDPSEGPMDDAAQYQAVRAILASERASVVALEEVSSEDAFERLLGDLPGQAGVLSGHAWTQKTALLWDSELLEVVHVRAIAGLDDAGRPPLEVKLRRRWDGGELLVVVVHAKAQADATSQAKRTRFAEGLKRHLDDQHAHAPSLVLGDFNDLLVGSLLAGHDSPYRAFLDDREFAAPTRALNAPGATENSYAFGDSVDHILVGGELAAQVDTASLNVLRDELLARYPSFTETVSDHFPVTIRLVWGRGSR